MKRGTAGGRSETIIRAHGRVLDRIIPNYLAKITTERIIPNYLAKITATKQCSTNPLA